MQTWVRFKEGGFIRALALLIETLEARGQWTYALNILKKIYFQSRILFRVKSLIKDENNTKIFIGI